MSEIDLDTKRQTKKDTKKDRRQGAGTKNDIRDSERQKQTDRKKTHEY